MGVPSTANQGRHRRTLTPATMEASAFVRVGSTNFTSNAVFVFVRWAVSIPATVACSGRRVNPSATTYGLIVGGIESVNL